MEQIAFKLSPFYQYNIVPRRVQTFFTTNQHELDLRWHPQVDFPDTCTSSAICQSCISIQTLRRLVTITTDGTRFVLNGDPLLYDEDKNPIIPPHTEQLPDQVALVQLYRDLGISPRGRLDPVVDGVSWVLEHTFGFMYHGVYSLLTTHIRSVGNRIPPATPWRSVMII